MKRSCIFVASALCLSVSGVAVAGIVTVNGHGQSYDPGIALEYARADAGAKCTAQAGTPLEEIYNHITRANLWLADSIWRCEVP